MKLRSICALSVLAVAFAALSIAAPQEDLVEEFRVDLEVWIEAVGEFISEVSFDEADMRSFLDLYPEFAVLMDGEADGAEENWEDEGWNEEEEASLAESFQEVIELLGDPGYIAWAAEKGLSAESWMHKSARILILSQRTVMAEYFQMSEAQMQEQVANLEAQREAAEEQLIAEHMDEIRQLLEGDEEDEWDE